MFLCSYILPLPDLFPRTHVRRVIVVRVVIRRTQAAVDGGKAAVNRIDIDVRAAVLHVFLELALHALQGVVDGLHMTVQLPGGWDEYLRNLYKNYMELPPVEKRERHFIISIELWKD